MPKHPGSPEHAIVPGVEVPYSMALTMQDHAAAYPDLHQGAYRDPHINNFAVIGRYDDGMKLFNPRLSPVSNRTSVLPWWYKSPFSLDVRALPHMASIIRYGKAMQTLDGETHTRVSKIVKQGLAEAVEDPEYEDTFKRLLDQEARHMIEGMGRAALGRTAQQGEEVDLRASMRRVRTGLLGVELGLPGRMQQGVIDTTDEQMRFLWGWPQPVRNEHEGLAKTVRGMFSSSFKLMDGYVAAIKEGEEVPNTVTAHLARAVVDKQISRGVAASTLFGLVNAGEGTVTSTGVNIAHDVLASGRWRSIAGSRSRIIPTVMDGMKHQPAVVAWQKQIEGPVTVQGHDGKPLELNKGDRALVVMGAMATDPNKPEQSIPEIGFGAGPHRCPGRDTSEYFLSRYLGRIMPIIPDAQLARSPEKIITTTFSGYSELPVLL